MNNWILAAVLAIALSLTACVDRKDCDEEPDDDVCQKALCKEDDNNC